MYCLLRSFSLRAAGRPRCGCRRRPLRAPGSDARQLNRRPCPRCCACCCPRCRRPASGREACRAFHSPVRRPPPRRLQRLRRVGPRPARRRRPPRRPAHTRPTQTLPTGALPTANLAALAQRRLGAFARRTHGLRGGHGGGGFVGSHLHGRGRVELVFLDVRSCRGDGGMSRRAEGAPAWPRGGRVRTGCAPRTRASTALKGRVMGEGWGRLARDQCIVALSATSRTPVKTGSGSGPENVAQTSMLARSSRSRLPRPR